MRRAVALMLLVGLATLALYGLALMAVTLLPDADIVSPLPISWTGAFALATVFAGWNLWDSLLDARAAHRRRATRRTIAGGWWRLRSDALQGACCTSWAGAGVLAILQWGTQEIRTALILAGALALVANQVWNRIDRERISHMPRPTRDAEALETIAIQLAADARTIGHDVASSLQAPVGTLSLLRERPDLTPQEVEDIDLSMKALLDLAAHVQRLHQHARSIDPSLRGPQP